MWICKSCGKENQSDLINCWSCSTPKDQTTVPPDPSQSLEATGEELKGVAPEQVLGNPFPKRTIYTQNSIWGGSLLGGPMVAGYIIARNFKAFDETNKAWATWIITLGVTALIFGFAVLSDTTWKGLPIVYTVIAYGLISHYQGPKIDAHIKAGGATHGYLNIIGVSIVGLIITLIPLIVIGVAVEGIGETETHESPTVKEYQALKHEIYFLRSNISVEETDKVADGLTKMGFFNDVSQKQVYVRKVNNAYEVSIPCTSEIRTNPDAYKELIPFRNGMQQLFPDNKIVLNLVVESWDNVVKRME